MARAQGRKQPRSIPGGLAPQSARMWCWQAIRWRCRIRSDRAVAVDDRVVAVVVVRLAEVQVAVLAEARAAVEDEVGLVGPAVRAVALAVVRVAVAVARVEPAEPAEPVVLAEAREATAALELPLIPTILATRSRALSCRSSRRRLPRISRFWRR